ncbi:predicted protein [Sclerotinia sclerotiorum 1980 UF-70]|uniref:Uncharacterized protein n=1 Tax=Sclerotinia sclerotiorum (strain ATCC 18683 / 1980 / Ss-1) TaxID=665079 RepID=A7E887_SCLS1|nr:predicted protein [Sclerotinia sclerotiorum 1980 UF-70]EDN96589.1 predicted protein [Sclerotinia sclerotiorum 1980 UF-70]
MDSRVDDQTVVARIKMKGSGNPYGSLYPAQMCILIFGKDNYPILWKSEKLYFEVVFWDWETNFCSGMAWALCELLGVVRLFVELSHGWNQAVIATTIRHTI